MSVTFQRIRVGEPVRHKCLALFPLYSETESQLEYQLADEAIAAENLLVEEINEGGSVPELLVQNKSDTHVLFLEGEELVGAKQNRILNTSVLVAAQTQVKIPVSCVEQGRWGYASRRFSSSGSHSPTKLRHSLKRSVTESLKGGGGHSSNQSEVWAEVAEVTCSHGTASPTMAMSDTFMSKSSDVESFREKLPYVDGATGIAIVLGDLVVSVDVFDKASTCAKVWNRLISGSILDALLLEDKEASAIKESVEQWLQSTEQLAWEKAKPVGDGDELRASGNTGEQGSALLYEGTLVHGSVIAGSA